MAWKLGKNTDHRTPDLIEIDYANGDATAEITQGDLVTNTNGVFSVAVTGGTIMGIAVTKYDPPTLQDSGDYVGLVLPITKDTMIEATLKAATAKSSITLYEGYDIDGATIDATATTNGDFVVTDYGKIDYATGDVLTVYGYFKNAYGARS